MALKPEEIKVLIEDSHERERRDAETLEILQRGERRDSASLEMMKSLGEPPSGRYHASRCPCGHMACNDWHVDPVAALQGVHFTERQARAVAALLNGMDADEREGRE